MLASLSLHAGEIRGFSADGGGGDAVLVAKTIRLDNSANVASPGAAVASGGSLTLDAGAGTIELGANALAIDQYDQVLNAALHGQGIALGRMSLASQYTRARQLVPLRCMPRTMIGPAATAPPRWIQGCRG